MGKVLRVLAILVGLLVVVVVAAALILPNVIDPNDYRDDIAKLVKDKTGRELTIAGDIGWSFFPWLGVEVGDTRLANAAGFGDEPFARVAAVQARVKLLPLLRKEVEMSTVVLDGLQLNLAKDKNGRTNWDDLTQTAAAPKAAEPKPADKAPSAMPIAALAIGGVSVKNAQLVWDDRAAGTKQRIENLNLQLGAIRPGQPVDVTLDFLSKGGKPELASQVKLAGEVTLADSLKQVSVRDLKLGLDAKGESMPGGRLQADLSSQLAVDLDKQTLDLSDLLLKVADLTLRGKVQGTGISGDNAQFSGSLKLDEFVPRELLKKLGQTPPEVSDSTVLGKAGAEFAFKATTNSASLSGLKMRLDDSAITGSAGVANFAKPAIKFDLALDAIDLDRYLPPQKPDEVKAAPTPGEAAAGGASALPVDTLRALNLNGSIKIGQLKAYQLRSTDITVTIAAKDGLVRVHPASAKLYQGSYNGDVTLDARGKTPRIAMDEKLNGVQLGPLMTDLSGKANVTGKADIAVKLTASGDDPVAMRKTMNGNASFSLADGTVKGMNMLGEISKAYALLKGKQAPAGSEGNKTDFTALTGTATITNGLVNNPDLFGKSPVMQVQGKGTADLVSEKLDYRVTTTLVDVLEGKGDLTGRPIPVHITGTFSAPKVGVDMQAALKEEVKKQIEKQIEKKLGGGVEEQKEKLQDKLEDQMKDKLKGLFGR